MPQDLWRLLPEPSYRWGSTFDTDPVEHQEWLGVKWIAFKAQVKSFENH